MLGTQVEYWKYKETVRHNKVSEELAGEQNRISWFTAHETQRHNIQQENIGWFNASENQRHNLVVEDVSYKTLSENIRHNKVQENIGYRNAQANMISANAKAMQARAQVALVPYQQGMYLAQTENQRSQVGYNNAKTSQVTYQTQLMPADYQMRSTQLKLNTISTIGDIVNGVVGNAVSTYKAVNSGRKKFN